MLIIILSELTRPRQVGNSTDLELTVSVKLFLYSCSSLDVNWSPLPDSGILLFGLCVGQDSDVVWSRV